MMKQVRIWTMAVLLATTTAAIAVPAHRGTAKVRQPDGSYVTIRLHGDEWRNFCTTEDGYTVVKDDKGCYVYAQREEGRLKATTMAAHDAAERQGAELDFVAKTAKYLMPDMTEETARMKQAVEQREAQKLNARRAKADGRRAAQYDYNNFRGLIILVEWNDKSFSRTDYKDIITDMVNTEGYKGYDNQVFTGSVCDYFSDNSLGRFKPQFDVVGPYKLNYSQYAYSKGNNYMGYRITKAAVDAADADVDFSVYDGDGDGMADLVFFIFAGNGANYSGNDSRLWWPHRSSLIDIDHWSYIRKDGVYLYDYASAVELYGYTTAPSTIRIDGIGTICHEFSHVLGLPDLYDTDYEQSGGESNHPGDWSVMAGGSYLNYSRTPVGYSLYERWAVGFCDDPEVITAAGSYTLPPLYQEQKGYRIDTPVANEYFLLENRQKTRFKWDSQLPGSGMLVHRVDFTNPTVWSMGGGGNKVNVNPSHNYYEVVRANGPRKSDGDYVASSFDLFPNNSKTSLTNTTTPANLKSWAGKENALGLLNIKTSSGNITFTVTDYQESPTGISDALPLKDKGQRANDKVYNLQGQRVTGGYRGLVIAGGKKVLKK